MPGGRPSIYTEEIATEFCSRLVDGTSTRKVCEMDDMPCTTTIFKWMAEKPEFSEQYAKAKSQAAEALAEEIFDIADDNAFDYIEGKDGELRVNNDAIQRARLRVDVRKWYLSKIVPKKYGERQQIDQTTTHKFEDLSEEELNARLQALTSKS